MGLPCMGRAKQVPKEGSVGYVVVTDGGDANLQKGQRVTRKEFDDWNKWVVENGGQKATARPA